MFVFSYTPTYNGLNKPSSSTNGCVPRNIEESTMLTWMQVQSPWFLCDRSFLYVLLPASGIYQKLPEIYQTSTRHPPAIHQTRPKSTRFLPSFGIMFFLWLGPTTKSTRNPPEIYQKSTRNLPETPEIYQKSTRFDRNLPDFYQISDYILFCYVGQPPNLPEIYQKSTRNLPEIYQKSTRNLPDSTETYQMFYTISADLLCCYLGQPPNLPKTYQNSTSNLPEIYQESTRNLPDAGNNTLNTNNERWNTNQGLTLTTTATTTSDHHHHHLQSWEDKRLRTKHRIAQLHVCRTTVAKT
jgi:hypothetical protein